jgi:putative methanogenesis marker protein 6
MKATKYVLTSPESNILPSDIAMAIYGKEYEVNLKETCFGVIIEGEEEVLANLIAEIREMDPTGIFIKDRGFPPGDPRRCRGRRGGGARPGYFMMECEGKTLPLISRALACEAKGDAVPQQAAPKAPIKIERLEEIVKDEFS